jgi:hypothetical protein
MNVEMTQELTLEEVIEAITSLPKGKALGHNGLSIEFFQENVEKIAPMFLLAFRAFTGFDLRIHQQRDDYFNPKIWRSFQVRKLATHHSPWKYLQNTRKNFNAKDPGSFTFHDQTQPDKFHDGEEHPGQQLSSPGITRMGNREWVRPSLAPSQLWKSL